MPQFLILPLETKQTFSKYGRAEMGAIVQRYANWTRALAKQRCLINGDRIIDGRHLKATAGKVATRRAGNKEETPGGYWLIRAKNLKAALQLCADCPHFEFGALRVLQIEGNREA